MEFNRSRLLSLMQQRGLNISQVSAMTGLAVSHVHGLVHEGVKSPRGATVTRLANGLGVDWRIFFDADVQEKEQAVQR